jgi:uncharacterized protein (TIGR00369 family)
VTSGRLPEDPAATRPYYRLLGIRALGPDSLGRQVLELRSRPELENSRGDVHGGVVASLLDAAIGVAVRAAYDPAPGATTASLTVNYVTPGRTRLVATGEVMRAGGSLASAQAHVVDQSGQLVAHAVGTIRILRPRS